MSTKIIADFCANHLGQPALIEHGIKLLAEAGVDIVKFQAFRASKLNQNFPNYDDNYLYYKSVELDDEALVKVVTHCNFYGIEPMFTVFNKDLVPRISNLCVKRIKIASPDGDNFELIDLCTKYFDEVIVSTGMIGDKDLIKLRKLPVKTLYCVSKYPTKLEDIDYNEMKFHAGFSDHSLGTEASKKAIDLDLEYVEKHFTLGRDLPGRDQFMSTTIDEFKELVSYKEQLNKIQIYKNRWR
jgi:sialic acid synthase SpsE